MSHTYLVPTDTARLLAQHIEKCQNFGLYLGRYIPRQVIDKETAKLERGRWLRELCRSFKPDEALVKSSYERWRAMTEGAARFRARLHGRLIVGLGGKGALEFGITLHRVTGLPYIPGSALKGLTRTYFLLLLAERLEKKHKNISLDKLEEALSEQKAGELVKELDENFVKLYREMFGLQGNAGTCVFYDAVLAEPPKGQLFTVDVMTPHFVKYYRESGMQPPSDDDNPNPVNYITVSEGVRFAFAIGKRRTTDKVHLADARYLLQEALHMLGVGSKTASGYGVFEPPPKEA
ncbi:MAG: type III-B CRISPR module RAMP protein Cmr6 [Aggregatilineales bacterium]